ncbi:MAG TPA: DUF2892 domain-containing protein [Flavipsychrobacter sp.]|nr:DUF2892 domain-containing protein [Flavipsychrobacter sp.]
MEKNMGTTDKTVRMLIVVVIAVLYFTNTISGTLAIVLGILAVVFVLTSFISFCPLYLPFGINTFKRRADEELSKNLGFYASATAIVGHFYNNARGSNKRMVVRCIRWIIFINANNEYRLLWQFGLQYARSEKLWKN